jgi:hypothetical protein
LGTTYEDVHTIHIPDCQKLHLVVVLTEWVEVNVMSPQMAENSCDMIHTTMGCPQVD